MKAEVGEPPPKKINSKKKKNLSLTRLKKYVNRVTVKAKAITFSCISIPDGIQGKDGVPIIKKRVIEKSKILDGFARKRKVAAKESFFKACRLKKKREGVLEYLDGAVGTVTAKKHPVKQERKKQTSRFKKYLKTCKLKSRGFAIACLSAPPGYADLIGVPMAEKKSADAEVLEAPNKGQIRRGYAEKAAVGDCGLTVNLKPIFEDLTDKRHTQDAVSIHIPLKSGGGPIGVGERVTAQKKPYFEGCDHFVQNRDEITKIEALTKIAVQNPPDDVRAEDRAAKVVAELKADAPWAKHSNGSPENRPENIKKQDCSFEDPRWRLGSLIELADRDGFMQAYPGVQVKSPVADTYPTKSVKNDPEETEFEALVGDAQAITEPAINDTPAQTCKDMTELSAEMKAKNKIKDGAETQFEDDRLQGKPSDVIVGDAQKVQDLADAFENEAGEQGDVFARLKIMLHDGSKDLIEDSQIKGGHKTSNETGEGYIKGIVRHSNADNIISRCLREGISDISNLENVRIGEALSPLTRWKEQAQQARDCNIIMKQDWMQQKKKYLCVSKQNVTVKAQSKEHADLINLLYHCKDDYTMVALMLQHTTLELLLMAAVEIACREKLTQRNLYTNEVPIISPHVMKFKRKTADLSVKFKHMTTNQKTRRSCRLSQRLLTYQPGHDDFG